MKEYPKFKRHLYPYMYDDSLGKDYVTLVSLNMYLLSFSNGLFGSFSSERKKTVKKFKKYGMTYWSRKKR